MRTIYILTSIIIFSCISFSQSVYKDSETGLWGAKDKNGDVFIRAEYDEIYKLDRLNNFRAVKDNNAYFFNSRGELLNKHHYEELGKFDYNAARIEQKGKYGVINEFGDMTIPIIYDDIVWPFWSYAAVSKAGRWGISDLSGNIIVPLIYDTIIAFPSSVKYAVVKLGGKYGVVDMISGELTHKCDLDDYFFTRFNYIKGVIDGKTGLLHYDGTVIAGFYYDDIRIEEDVKFGAKFIYVKSAGKWGVNNEHGGIVFTSDYDDIGTIDKKGFASATKDGKSVMLDMRNGIEK